MATKVDVVYLQDRNGRYTNGFAPVSQKWEAMKSTGDAEYWLYTGAQRGAVFDSEFKRISIPEKDAGAWRERGFVVRDF